MEPNRKAAHEYYDKIRNHTQDSSSDTNKVMRHLAKTDLFFLLVCVLKRSDADHDWLYDRCKEVYEAPNSHLDLWSRAFYKSTIITFALTIQDILKDPNTTVGIFSYTRPIAKAFLRQIKREFEENALLKGLFPEIFYDKPKTQSPKWSENDGIVVKRGINPKESTVEACGLIDSMPTSRHYSLRVYDDIVSDSSVTSPEMLNKVTQAWGLSQSLGTEHGVLRVVGTRYHFADTYSVILQRKSLTPRIYPATHDGTESGDPIFLTRESLKAKRRDMGAYIYACQMLLNPVADELQELKPSWLQTWNATSYDNMNIYITVDPANEKKKGSDYTVFTVFGIGVDNNYYIITWVRDKLNLTERANTLFALQRKFRPEKIAYEKYGMQSDIEHFKDRMDRENYHFRIQSVAGQTKKEDRIRRLVPLFEQGRIFLPQQCIQKNTDLTQVFMNEEFRLFPYSPHDDMLDSMSRIMDIKIERPDMIETSGLNFGNLPDRDQMQMDLFKRQARPDIDYILTHGMRR